MRVAAVQFKADKGRKRHSLARLVELTRRGAEGADLVVLPEMAATGYLFSDPTAAGAVAEDPEGPTFQALAPVASAHRTWVVCGVPERAGDRLFNSALVIDPHGMLRFVYRKTLLFDADTSWATPGDSGYAVFDTGSGRFGVGICMDLNDDEFVAWCAGAGLDVVALPTNWLYEGYPVWSYWIARMAGVDAALVSANSWGPEGDIVFCGMSAVLDRGRVVAGAPMAGDTVVSARLSPKSLETVS